MKVLGKTDERTTCEKCGKQRLKVTVALETDEGSIVYYGTTCAARALRSTGVKVSKSELDDTARAIGIASKWFAAGYSNEDVRSGIWNKLGFSAVVTETGIAFKDATGMIQVNR